MNLTNIIDADNEDITSGWDEEILAHYKKGDFFTRSRVCFIKFPTINGVRFTNQKLPTDFVKLRNQAHWICNITSPASGAKLIFKNDDGEYETEYLLKWGTLEIPMAILPYASIRAEGLIYCDYIILRHELKMNMLKWHPHILTENLNAYGGKFGGQWMPPKVSNVKKRWYHFC